MMDGYLLAVMRERLAAGMQRSTRSMIMSVLRHPQITEMQNASCQLTMKNIRLIIPSAQSKLPMNAIDRVQGVLGRNQCVGESS